MTQNTKKIKIGLDFHGVIDARPEFFQTLTEVLVKNGHEVHILTGSKAEIQKEELEKHGIHYTHLFSITDHHVKLGTPIVWDEKGEAHLDPYLWDRAKAEYCTENEIDLHFDDSDIYNYFFKTPYARFLSRDTKRAKKTHLK